MLAVSSVWDPLLSILNSVHLLTSRGFLIAQLVKNLSAMQETPVQFLGQEDELGEGIGYPLQYSWTSLWLSW